MSRQFRNQYKRGNFGRFNGGQNRGIKRIKSFNPTELVNNLQPTEEKEQEYFSSHSFSDFEISSELKRNILEKGYKSPTPIQDQAIELILNGRDLVGIANTGTGKTAAFLIPLIDKVLKNRANKVLILTPTRELATQIRNELLGFSKSLNIYSCLCIGGENIKRQIRDLSRNPNFIIATPGRIQDLIRSRTVNLGNFSSVVLDETDRMVDIGFIKDIKYIISLLPKVRQSLFFSATVDDKVKEILQSFVQNPTVVSVKKQEIAKNVDQKIIRISGNITKVEKLRELLADRESKKVLIFGRTKHGVQKLSNELNDKGFRADAIHGNKNQSQRVKVLEKFKRDEVAILVATDVASRGLDIPNVTHVINYDLPESRDAYVHRIGRTGRADKKGIAITFV